MKPFLTCVDQAYAYSCRNAEASHVVREGRLYEFYSEAEINDMSEAESGPVLFSIGADEDIFAVVDRARKTKAELEAPKPFGELLKDEA